MVPSSFGFVTSPITVIESPSDSFEAISCPLNSSEESIVARRNDNSAKRGGESPPSRKVLHNAKVAKDAGGFADCLNAIRLKPTMVPATRAHSCPNMPQETEPPYLHRLFHPLCNRRNRALDCSIRHRDIRSSSGGRPADKPFVDKMALVDP